MRPQTIQSLMRSWEADRPRACGPWLEALSAQGRREFLCTDRVLQYNGHRFPPIGWDRARARPALGGGLPFLLFRLQDGFTVPPWLRFPWPPYNAGRPDFPWSGLKPWLSSVDLPSMTRGLSAGAHTPRLHLV